MTRTVAVTALLLQAIAGYDADDVTIVVLPAPDYTAALDSRSRPRLGIARSHFFEGADPEVAAALEAALRVLADFTSEQRDVLVPAYLDSTVFRAEIFATHRQSAAENPEGFQPDTLRRVQAGADVDAATYIAKRREQIGRAHV